MTLSRELLEKRKETAQLLQELWASVLPEFVPETFQFYLWLDRYGAELAERAIRVTAIAQNKRRAVGRTMEADSLVRYTSGTMSRMATDTGVSA